MKIKLLALVAVVFIHSKSYTQVTIGSFDFPFVQKAAYQQADTVGLPKFPGNLSAHYDFSSVKAKGPLRVVDYENGALHPFFTQSVERSTQNVAFGPLQVKQQLYYSKNSFAYFVDGAEYQYQKFGLGFLSGDNADSVTFPEQRRKFPFSYWEIRFPLSWKTNWAMATPNKMRTDFILDISLASYSNTPCYIIQSYTKKDSVINYGTASIPEKTSGIYYNCLVLRSEIIRVDSFYIDNQPANNFLLGALGLNQSDTVRTYMYRFIRPDGGIYSLANIYFTDNTYKNIEKVEYSNQLMSLGIDKLVFEDASVYPNPSSGEGFTVKLGTDEQQSRFVLTDITGKQIPVLATNQGSGEYSILPNAMLSAGVYTLHVSTSNEIMMVKILIQ